MEIICIKETEDYKGSSILYDLSKTAEEYNKNYLYFPFHRKFGISKEKIEAFNLTYKLSHSVDLLKKIESTLDISDPFSYDICDLNVDITNGYMQLLNILYQALIYQPEILIIDDFRKNLHPLTEHALLQTLKNISNINYLIITTTTSHVLDRYFHYLPDDLLYVSIYHKLFK